LMILDIVALVFTVMAFASLYWMHKPFLGRESVHVFPYLAILAAGAIDGFTGREDWYWVYMLIPVLAVLHVLLFFSKERR
ncbi:MAG: hypothetical protein AAGE92_09025, partial [Cyanobacteria bacterium P01_G01_bin.4]